jgi:hypothetical protein
LGGSLARKCGFYNCSRIPPLVLGKDNKPLKSSTRFADLINISEDLGENIKKHIPVFEFQLVELYRMPFEKILGTPLGILTLRALKAEKLQALLDDAVWDESLLIQLPSASFEMLCATSLTETLTSPPFRGEHKHCAIPNSVKTPSHSPINSAKKAVRGGRQEGRQEGLIFSKQQDVLGASEIHFEQVPEGLSEEIELIADTAKLQELHRATIRSATLEEFAQAL